MKTPKFRLVIAIFCLVGGSILSAQTRSSKGSQKPLATRQIVTKVMPSVVVVVAQDNQGNTISQGSGFAYKPGLIVTNLHVVKRASAAFVRVAGTEVNYKITKVVALDARHDLCILRINEKVLPPIATSYVNKPSIGDEVFAFGNPRGLEGSVSKGIVSSIRADLGLLQIDAAISPGSSGGPVVNDRGELIGISVSSLVTGQNLNFAVSSAFLLRMSDEQFINESLKKVGDILGVPSDFGVPVSTAGSVAVTDREAAFLRGAVQIVKSDYAFFDYDEKLDKDIETARKPSEKYVYDQLGNLIEDWKYHYGDLAWKYFYSYDGNGLRTNVIWEPAPGIDEKRETYNYSPEEAAFRRLSVDRITLTGVFEDKSGKRVYDGLGNLTESVIKDSEIRWLNTFDENGLVTEQKLYEKEKLTKVFRYTYQFDSRGNWTKQLKAEFNSKYPSIGFSPLSVIYREIAYF